MDYESLVQDALRSVIRQVLKETQANGLTPPCHFYLSFATNYPGVEVPDFLRESNPEEVTIVLQHQFWDLTVEQDYFSVLLNFQEVPHKITIPFKALMTFMDPGVKFGLQFSPPPIEIEAPPLEKKPSPSSPPTEEPRYENNVIALDAFRKK